MFITFEGPEGSGKTTQMADLAVFLEAEGYEVFLTREPGGTPISDQIRNVLMDHKNAAMFPRTEILLFLASRAQHVAEAIRPQLAEGKVVLCDRYGDSTLAYQGYGHGVDLEMLKRLNAFATENLQPDLTVLLDVKVEAGLERRARGGDWNRLDAYQLAFHKRVYTGYHALAAEEPDRWVVVDANRPPRHVQAALRKILISRLAGQEN